MDCKISLYIEYKFRKSTICNPTEANPDFPELVCSPDQAVHFD